MIWCIGLPRTGGQSLQHALYDMYPEVHATGIDYFWHSVEPDRWDVVKEDTIACLEVYAPIVWCLNFTSSTPHKFIVNTRDPNRWFESCVKFFGCSRRQRWNHPMWQYPPSQWIDYYWEYYDSRIDALSSSYSEYIEFDPTNVSEDDHRKLCSFLGRPHPGKIWPNVDKFGRRSAHIPLHVNNQGFYDAFKPLL